jgi:hypothetical protein
MVAKETKFVSKEYHEGQMAYERGAALTSNPYLATPDKGLWYWAFGWQDAMADDVRNIKQTILAAAAISNTSTNRRPH